MTFHVALCAGNGVYLRHVRLRAIRPCAPIRQREFLKCRGRPLAFLSI